MLHPRDFKNSEDWFSFDKCAVVCSSCKLFFACFILKKNHQQAIWFLNDYFEWNAKAERVLPEEVRIVKSEPNSKLSNSLII